MDLDLRTPAHERLVADLLAWEQPRPVADPDLVAALRQELDEGLRAVARSFPPGQRLFLGKTTLNTLVCDGRYLDHTESDFEWSLPLILGKLAHRAFELDQATRRQENPETLVRHAWDEFSTAPGSLADYLNGLDRITASATRHQCEQRVAEYRDLWPLLPAGVPFRTEVKIKLSAADGAIVVQGTPDIVVGAIRDDRCRLMLVDLKTGHRNPMSERQDLRLYALLAAIKYGQPPFRWATYYVSEGAWDVEDLAPELLQGAARRVIDGAERAARLVFDEPSELRLVGGSWCRFCGRADSCEAAELDQA